MMPNNPSIKRKIINSLAKTILRHSILEKLLRVICYRKFFRENLKFGAMAFACLSVLEEREARVSDMGKYKMWVDISEYSGMTLYFFNELNEPFSAKLVYDLIREGDICIDIGANFGSYTFLMASKVGPQGRVVAFEPNPQLYKMLGDSIELNQFSDFVLRDSRALYSRSGEILKLYLSTNIKNSGHSSLINHGVCLSEDRWVTVKTLTISDYFKQNALAQCRLMKIDVERAESEVVKGMEEILEKPCIDYILMENSVGSEAHRKLDAAGYKSWFIDEIKKVLVDSKLVESGCMGNYIYVNSNSVNKFNDVYAPRMEKMDPSS